MQNSPPGLTEKEKEVIDHLAAAWNAFIELKMEHVSDIGEFQTAIHVAKNIIALRVAGRVVQKTWCV